MFLLPGKTGTQAASHRRGDIGLYRKDVVQLSVIGLRPEGIFCVCIVQLCDHPHSTSGPPHAPFEDRARTEPTPNGADR